MRTQDARVSGEPKACCRMLTPVGVLEITEDGEGICAVDVVRDAPASGTGDPPPTPLLTQAVRELTEYFAGGRKAFDLPLSPHGTPFQRSVWDALTMIPYGETRTYAEIAAAVGCPKGARAVGMANHNNPVMILIPCHRVIGANGSLTGYAGGLDVKKALLTLEGSRTTHLS